MSFVLEVTRELLSQTFIRSPPDPSYLWLVSLESVHAVDNSFMESVHATESGYMESVHATETLGIPKYRKEAAESESIHVQGIIIH